MAGRSRGSKWMLISGWLLVALWPLLGCNEQQVEQWAGEVVTASRRPVAEAMPPAPAGDSIRIASFNIQVLGQSKLAKPRVMDVLAKVARRFDVLAIQELRSKEQNVIPQFLQRINAAGRRYESVVGPRLGRTVSKEQYVFLYDTTRIELDPNSVGTIDDPRDLLHRPPLYATFRTRQPSPADAFTFTLINVHTDPDEVDLELDALDDVWQVVRRGNPSEDDVVLLGDLNAGYGRLGQLETLPGFAATVRGEPTNTRRSKSYDNILFDQRATVEFTGKAGILDLMAEFGLTPDEALQVSDHLPVWGEFSVYENGQPRLASRPR